MLLGFITLVVFAVLFTCEFCGVAGVRVHFLLLKLIYSSVAVLVVWWCSLCGIHLVCGVGGAHIVVFYLGCGVGVVFI